MFEDAYRRAYFTLERWKQDRELLLGATAACCLLAYPADWNYI